MQKDLIFLWQKTEKQEDRFRKGVRMKRLKLPPLLALTICLEMIISPVVHAQNALQIIGALGSVLTQQQPTGPSPQAQAQIAMVAQQANARTIDRYFNAGELMNIPGFPQYLNSIGITRPNDVLNCFSLPTMPTVVKAAVCTDTAQSSDIMALTMQRLEAEGYQTAYDQVSQAYKNAQRKTTNATQDNEGVGCMEKVSQILGGFFQSRENELNTLLDKIERDMAAFEAASKADLNAIEELSVALYGADNDLLADRVRSRRGDDIFQFDRQFNDPACSTMFTAEQFRSNGMKSGFSGINDLLKRTYETPNGGRYSGQSYAQASAAVRTDIQNMAVKVANQAKMNFGSMTGDNGFNSFVQGLRSSISSTTGANAALSADIFADVQAQFQQKTNDFATTFQNVSKEFSSARVDPSAALQALRDPNSATFDAEVSKIQVRLKNACLSRQLDSSMLTKIEHRGTTDHANRYNPNLLKKTIQEIMSNENTTPEQKLREIRQAEAQNGNRYNLKVTTGMPDPRNPGGPNISPRDIDTPSKYIGVLVETCELQFQRNTLDNMTGAAAIGALKSLRQEYQNFAQTNATAMQQAITNKLLECPGETAGTTVGSCDGSRFNNARPGFCARVAEQCAGNMRSCVEKTQQFVTQQKQQRVQRVQNYKDQMDAVKQQIVAGFEALKTKFELEAKALNGQFGVGYKSPTGIMREVPEGQRFLSEFTQLGEGSIQLENPVQFANMFRQNVEKLRGAIVEQQNQILGTGGRGGLLANHIEQVKKNYQEAEREVARYSQECRSAVARLQGQENQMRQQFARQQEEQMKQLGEQRNAVCALYTRAQADANGACSQEVDNTVAGAAAVSGVYGQFRNWCQSNGFHNQEGSSSAESMQVTDICISVLEDGTDYGGRIKTLCEARQRDYQGVCEPRTVGTGDNQGTAPNTVCIDRNDGEILAYYRRNRNGNEDLDPPQMPADCVAGDNSQRFSNPFNMGAAGNRGIASPVGGAMGR